MSQPDQDVPPSRRAAPRWMRLLLVVSLAVNLLVLGVVAGAALTGGGPWRGVDHHGGPMARALAPEDRRILRERMIEARSGARDGRAAHRAAMQELLTLLRASPYDSDAVAAQMGAVRGHFLNRMERGQALLIDRLSEMSAEERAAYADRLADALRHGPRR